MFVCLVVELTSNFSYLKGKMLYGNVTFCFPCSDECIFFTFKYVCTVSSFDCFATVNGTKTYIYTSKYYCQGFMECDYKRGLDW
jgi:hypothetical protein